MMPWRKVAVLAVALGFTVGGCTVTTSDNVDSGVYEETGGAGNQGGSSSTGGTTGPGTTVVQCTPDYQAPTAGAACGDDQPGTTCDSCLQTHNCTAAYQACFVVGNDCTGKISAMMQCMYDAALPTGTLPDGADANCQASSGISGAGAGAAQALALWTEIANGLDCSIVCCAVL
jgi:hypothetical protein